MHNLKNIAILGSTGSIGTQTLDIIEEYPDRFKVAALVARSSWETLAHQAIKFKAPVVVIADERYYPSLKEALAGTDTEVLAGSKAIEEIMDRPDIDIAVTAMVGYSGLASTLKAIHNGITVALANKETLVAGGALIKEELRLSGSSIVPVDSEHSAIFQCLQGERRSDLHKIILTASGGPFRTTSIEKMKEATVDDALRHPNWSMGAKVTIDSATMMNKGFEMIEAKWLFDCEPSQIEIAVHPQSIIHSMVEFTDGSIKAQLGVPDMRMPIRYALGYPERLPSRRQTLSLSQYSTLTFEAPDMVKFPLLGFAFEAIAKGGNAPCALNAANEVAVAALLKRKLKFADMPSFIQSVTSKASFIPAPSYSDVIATHHDTVAIADNELKRYI